MKVMFLDESGDHSLAVVDRQYPVFVLGGVIADQGYAEGVMTDAVAGFKRDMGIPLDLVLHLACAIRKDKHLSRYGLAAADPYMFSLDVLVERFCFEIGSSGPGVIVAESRDPTLDNQLELAWLNLKIQGTTYLRAAKITRCIGGLNIRGKRENIAGLQLADLVVSPIGRHVMGKPPKEDWAVVESKLRRRGGSYLGAGLVVLPKE